MALSRASLYTLFKIDPHNATPRPSWRYWAGSLKGVLGCDYFSAYRRFMRECDVASQFCLAHLIRDVKFLDDVAG